MLVGSRRVMPDGGPVKEVSLNGSADIEVEIN